MSHAAPIANVVYVQWRSTSRHAPPGTYPTLCPPDGLIKRGKRFMHCQYDLLWSRSVLDLA
jgi:hypothetical protein